LGDSGARAAPGADYFSFATLLQVLATGAQGPIWSNAEAREAPALQRYAAEYAQAAPAFDDMLRGLGYGAEDRDFLLACLDPDPDGRPTGFRGPPEWTEG
jgi:hypothetical protein